MHHISIVILFVHALDPCSCHAMLFLIACCYMLHEIDIHVYEWRCGIRMRGIDLCHCCTSCAAFADCVNFDHGTHQRSSAVIGPQLNSITNRMNMLPMHQIRYVSVLAFGCFCGKPVSFLGTDVHVRQLAYE